MKKWLLLVAMASCHILSAQTNVRAWYAQGQVWIIWQAQQPLPETFAVYKKNTAFTHTGQATAIGRLYANHWDYCYKI